MRRFLAAGVLLCASMFVPAMALGHAELVSATPADGTTVEGPDVPIVLVFSKALGEGSKADVLDPSDAVITTLLPDPADATRLISPADGAAFNAGDYTIRWTSVAEDGDILRGVLGFTVTAPPPTPAPTPTLEPSATPVPPTPTPVATIAPTPAPSAPPGNGAGDGSAVVAPIIAALVLVGFVAWWLVRRRPSAP